MTDDEIAPSGWEMTNNAPTETQAFALLRTSHFRQPVNYSKQWPRQQSSSLSTSQRSRASCLVRDNKSGVPKDSNKIPWFARANKFPEQFHVVVFFFTFKMLGRRKSPQDHILSHEKAENIWSHKNKKNLTIKITSNRHKAKPNKSLHKNCQPA